MQFVFKQHLEIESEIFSRFLELTTKGTNVQHLIVISIVCI